MNAYDALFAQIVAGQVDAAWVLDVLVLIVITVIGFLFKEIKNDIKEIKSGQHKSDIRIARIETKLNIDDE